MAQWGHTPEKAHLGVRFVSESQTKTQDALSYAHLWCRAQMPDEQVLMCSSHVTLHLCRLAPGEATVTRPLRYGYFY